jgi:uncharacterized protein (TIGR03437 family)
MVVTPWALQAFGGRPLSGRSGVPGELSCANTGCHTGPPNIGNGQVTLSFDGSPNSYLPGVRQQITVRVSDPVAVTYGFQLTARLASDPRVQAGSLTEGPGTAVMCSRPDFSAEQEKTSAGCPAGFPIESVSHTRPNPSGVWTVSWDPPPGDPGAVVIHVAGNAANGNGRVSGDWIYTSRACLGPFAPASSRPTVAPCGIVTPPAFGSASALAPGSWIEITGENLAAEPIEWTSGAAGDLPPTRLGGVEVKFGNQAAHLRSVSPGQISGIVPFEATLGETKLIIQRGNELSVEVPVLLRERAPALDRTALHSDGAPVTPERPAQVGEVIVFQGIGFGPVPLPTVGFRLGSTDAQVESTESAPGVPGLYRFHVVVPAGLAGMAPVQVLLNGTGFPQTVTLLISGG